MNRLRLLILTLLIALILHVFIEVSSCVRINAPGISEMLENGDYASLERHLEQYPEAVGARPVFGGDALLAYCVQRGDVDGVTIALAHGASPNEVGFSRRRALHLAVESDNPHMVKLLVDAGADIEATGYRLNSTPLHLAARCGALDMVELLISLGANVNSRNALGQTPLMVAGGERWSVVVKALLDAGANISALDERGRSAADLHREQGRAWREGEADVTGLTAPGR